MQILILSNFLYRYVAVNGKKEAIRVKALSVSPFVVYFKVETPFCAHPRNQNRLALYYRDTYGIPKSASSISMNILISVPDVCGRLSVKRDLKNCWLR